MSSSGTQSSPEQPINDQNNCSCQGEPQWQGQGQNTPATSINTTAIRKEKDKNKDKKNLSNIEYYTYKQKSHYTNKCPKKEPKN